MIPLLVNLVLIPALLMLAGYGVRQFAAKTVPTGLLRFWLYPGVAVHELSHATACLPALAKVKSIVLLRADGSGEVVHDEPRVPVLGMILISLAPLAGGPLVLVLLNSLLDNPLAFRGQVTGNGARSFVFIGHLLEFTWYDVVAAIEYGRWLSWEIYVVLIATVSISLTMVPSDQDLKNASKSIVIVLAVVAAWMVISELAGFTDDPVVRFVTWMLGFAHIGFFCFALSLGVVGVFALIAKLTGGK